MNSIRIGQRWMSDAEPELGLGIVRNLDQRIIGIHFSGGDIVRQYAVDAEVIKRVAFRVGDSLKTLEGYSFEVRDIRIEDHLISYHSGNEWISEADICFSLSFNAPEERLLGGHLDDYHAFDLRYETLQHRYEISKSPVRGFLGGRIDLIPHQFYLAHEVASRHIPRVLLADEVGLGKTIEAALILHRLLLSEQILRVLIVLPAALTHQWFVELIRRFNLSFHIFDEAFFDSLPEDHASNPFNDFQLGLCSIDFLTGNPERCAEAISAGWDMVVVDEAHHLEWSESNASREYLVVEELSKRTPGLLLLTATPEQLGVESHFARLRLLDPYRYSDFSVFREEKYEEYALIANVCEKLLGGVKLSSQENSWLEKKLESFGNKENLSKEKIADHLLDHHGMGRVMFRNTRKKMKGFPVRKAFLSAIHVENVSEHIKEKLRSEFSQDISRSGDDIFEYDFSDDPRLDWVIDFLREHKTDKILMICRFKEKVIALERAIQEKFKTKIGLFHEDLSLIQRDRNAAWFAEEGGAQLMICSEIGSEGRNFQFSHHLILFDLPLDQELLEQRIGRLDRIGQKQTINIYIPFLRDSPQEKLAHWYHQGLNAFEQNNMTGSFFDEKYDQAVIREALADSSKTFEALLKETCELVLDVKEKIEKGSDRLLELHSFRPSEAEQLLDCIRSVDQDGVLFDYMDRIFDFYGVKSEALNSSTLLLTADHLFSDAFPLLVKDEGVQVTYSRQYALSREDIQFMSWDHPMVVGAMDMLLGSERGNSALCLWPDSEDQSILLEAIYVLECVAPKELYCDRFLPAQPIRVVVNQRLENVTSEFHQSQLKGKLKEGKYSGIMDEPHALRDLIQNMVETSQGYAENEVDDVIAQAIEHMRLSLSEGIERLRELRKVNDHVSDVEIEMAVQNRKNLEKYIGDARMRLDGLRLIFKSPIA